MCSVLAYLIVCLMQQQQAIFVLFLFLYIAYKCCETVLRANSATKKSRKGIIWVLESQRFCVFGSEETWKTPSSLLSPHNCLRENVEITAKITLPNSSFYHCSYTVLLNWTVSWKNRISSTPTKLRKSLVKPVTWQNISSCLVLPAEIVMHNAFNI